MRSWTSKSQSQVTPHGLESSVRSSSAKVETPLVTRITGKREKAKENKYFTFLFFKRKNGKKVCDKSMYVEMRQERGKCHIIYLSS